MEIGEVKAYIRNYPVAFCASVLSLVLGLYLYFTLNTLSEFEIRQDELESDLRILKSNYSQGNDIQADLKALKALFETVDSRLVDPAQIANNNDFFYTLGEQLPVEISEVSQKQVIAEKNDISDGEISTLRNYSVIPVEMKVTGLLNDMLDFFYQLDQSERITRVVEYDLSVAEDVEPGYMEMTLQLEVLGKPVNAS